MRILVANLGSTSFKYRLFADEGDGPALLAEGGYQRVTDFVGAIDSAMAALKDDGHLQDDGDIDAVAFKTVQGGEVSGCLPADERVIEALENTKSLAPAHNPAYIAGIKAFEQRLPNAKRVALFETAFYQWVPEASRLYAAPESWRQAGLRRYGFHGASHKFIAERTAQLMGEDALTRSIQKLYQDGPPAVSEKPLRVISCHLGGSSSVTGICNGVAIGSSMGLTPQSGLPQNNRVGDLDSGAIPFAMRSLGLSLEEAERQLSQESGLLALSGVSNDMRDVREAAAQGNEKAKLTMEHFAKSLRHWIGAFFFEMGGVDAIAFTGGIGENDSQARAAALSQCEALGIEIDQGKNDATRGEEADIASEGSATRIYVIPANEEKVIARECRQLIESGQYETLSITLNN